jgi:pilus assembly protein Flp/PilA
LGSGNVRRKEAGVRFATQRKHDKERGQGLVEYALIILLVAVIVVAGLTLLGTSLNSMFTSVAASL